MSYKPEAQAKEVWANVKWGLKNRR